MNKIILKKYDNIFFHVETSDWEQDKQLKDYMSCYIENHWFHPKVKSKVWNGKLSFYDMKNQLLPIGLFPLFKDFCDVHNYTYELDFDKKFIYTEISDERLKKLFEIVFKDSEYKPYDYQEEAISNGIRQKRGVLLSATGSGKSLMMYVLVRYLLYLKKNCLIVVPNTNLVEQLFSDFKDYGWKDLHKQVCTLYGGQEYNEKLPVLISTWQSLQNKPKEFFDRFGGLMIDECVHPDTLITMSDGKKKKISEIIIGDKIKTLNEKYNKIENKEVIELHKNLNKVNELYYIEDEDGNIHFKDGITGNHKVKTNNGWKRVDKLVEGDLIESN